MVKAWSWKEKKGLALQYCIIHSGETRKPFRAAGTEGNEPFVPKWNKQKKEMLQTVSKLGKEWWWEKWPEPEQSFSHCPVPDSSSVSNAQAHISSSPGQSWWATDLCKGMQPLADITGCLQCSTSQHSCSVFESWYVIWWREKIKATPSCSKSPALLWMWPRKHSRHLRWVWLRNIIFSTKNPHSKVQTEWKDLKIRRRRELSMVLTVKH